MGPAHMSENGQSVAVLPPMIAAMDLQTTAEQDACYLALKARDARFDGSFFTAVTSTGIYCRPVCKVRTPKRENCRFYTHAAQAESAGFRPCLRCRPELAPHALVWSTQDASGILAQQAARWMVIPTTEHTGESSVQQLATRLGINMVRGISPKVGRVRAEGKVIHCGRQLATAEARLVGPDGTLYAHATTTCLVFDLPKR